MAKVLFTAVVAEMRGKLAGTVFTRNRGGAVARTKVSPSNNRTNARQIVRTNLASISALWRTLTQGQQDGWAAMAPFYSKTDAFGNKKSLSGQQLFVSSNATLAMVGIAPRFDAPLFEPSGYTGTPDMNVVATGTGSPLVEAVFTTVTADANVKFLVRATPVMSAGINNPTGRFKLVAFGVADGANTNITVLYTDVYGAPKPGGKIFFEIVPYNETTGQQGVPFVVVANT